LIHSAHAWRGDSEVTLSGELKVWEAQAAVPRSAVGSARLQRWTIEASWQLYDALVKSAADATALNQQLVTYTRPARALHGRAVHP
jgi:hypothetical protein